MAQFSPRVSRHTDSHSRFSVEFTGPDGDSVTVECHAPDSNGDGHARSDAIRSALEVVRKLAHEDPAEFESDDTSPDATPEADAPRFGAGPF